MCKLLRILCWDTDWPYNHTLNICIFSEWVDLSGDENQHQKYTVA